MKRYLPNVDACIDVGLKWFVWGREWWALMCDWPYTLHAFGESLRRPLAPFLLMLSIADGLQSKTNPWLYIPDALGFIVASVQLVYEWDTTRKEHSQAVDSCRVYHEKDMNAYVSGIFRAIRNNPQYRKNSPYFRD